VIKILGTLLIAAVLGCPVAHADALDDQFINSLNKQGVSGDRGELIAQGHAACDNYATPAFAGQMADLVGHGMSGAQAQALLIGGIRAYCPQKMAGGFPR
jgi:hypothetical protein